MAHLPRILALLFGLIVASPAAFGQTCPQQQINAQTGTTYTVLNSDNCKKISLSNGSAVAVALPQAGSNGNFGNTWSTTLVNLGAGAVTITPTTSTIDGRASFVLQQGGGVTLTSNGTNYISSGLFPALNTSGIVDSDQLPTATNSVKGAVIAGTCLEMGGTGNKTMSVSTGCRTSGIEFWIDGGGAAVTTSTCSFTAGQGCYIHVPFACTITNATLVGDGQTGSAVIEVAKVSRATFVSGTIPTSGDKITASAPPTVSSAKASSDSTLTGWTTSIAADTIVAFSVTSSSTFTRILVSLPCLKT